MINKQVIKGTDKINAQGPYSIGISFKDTLFLSAVLPIDENSEIVSDDIKAQTIQVIENIEAILEVHGCDLSHVLKTNVSVSDMNDYAVINQVMAIYFPYPYPARAVVEVSALPKNAKIQMECIVAFEGIEVEQEEELCETCD